MRSTNAWDAGAANRSRASKVSEEASGDCLHAVNRKTVDHFASQMAETSLPPVERCILSVKSVVFRSLPHRCWNFMKNISDFSICKSL